MLIVSLICILTAFVIIVKKRKKLTNKGGVKSWITPVCFFLIPLLTIMAYTFDFILFSGFVHWGMNVVLFVIAAYYTKFLPVPE